MVELIQRFIMTTIPSQTQKNSVLNSQKDAVWSNTAHLGAGLGQIELKDAVITPYVGVSYTKTEFLASNLDWLRLHIYKCLHYG